MSAAPKLPIVNEEADNEFAWNLAMAAVEFFYAQFEVSVRPKTPEKFKVRLETGKTIRSEVDVIGKGVKAVLHLAMTEKAFLNVMNRMMGETYTSINEENESGITELINIIYGSAKEFFGKDGVSLERALPRIVKATDINTRASKARNSILIPFESESGTFELIVAFEN